MIMAIDIKIKFDNMDLFKDIHNISYSDDADIEIITFGENAWKILQDGKLIEYWTTLHASPQKDPPSIYISGDKELMPYCMKDRLAYLQDKINKEKGRYG